MRSLLLLTACMALLMVPVVWVTRNQRRMMRAQREMLQAREVALRSVIHEQARRFKSASLPVVNGATRTAPSLEPNSPPAEETAAVEQLRHENEGLKQQLEQLRREVETLKSDAKRESRP
jgi:hypothetical protein